MREIIKKAMEVFEIPPHRTNFLFLLPPFYVAKADGKISFKETSSICYNAARLGLIGPQDQDSEDDIIEFLLDIIYGNKNKKASV